MAARLSLRSCLALLGVSLAAVAATCHPSPPPQPPTWATVRTVTVHVTDQDQHGVEGAAVSGLRPTIVTLTNSEGLAFVENVDVDTHVVDLHVRIARCLPFDAHLTLPNGFISVPVTLACAVPVVYPFPAEVGPLRRDGKFFRTDTAVDWRWRGVDSYLGFARFLRGEAVSVFSWARALGFNVVRVFGQVSASRGWPDWADFEHPDDRPDFDAKLRAFFGLGAAAGVRVEYTVLTYPDSAERQRRYLQRVYDLAQAFPLVSVEVANEPDPQGIDAVAALSGVDRHGVLSAYGYYDPRPTAGQPSTLAMLDYVTIHTDRGPEWPRKAKDALELRDGFGDATTQPDWFLGTGRPTVGDEPMGAAELDQPGRRAASVSDFRASFGVCALFSAGCTYHFQAGLEGRIPSATEPVQAAIAAAIIGVWQAIPPVVPTCSYTRGGLEFPLQWQESDSLRSYGMVCGQTAYVVVVRPKAGYVPVASAGWRVTSSTSAVIVLTRN